MEKIRVFCKNTNKYYSTKPGTRLVDFLKEIKYREGEHRVLAAYVNNQLKGLGFEFYIASTVDFLDITKEDGRRTYVRSLSFLLQRAIFDLYPDCLLSLDYTLPNGLYGELRDKKNFSLTVPTTDEDICKILDRMTKLVKENFLFIKIKKTNAEARALYESHGQQEKAKLLESIGSIFASVYYLDGYADTFYGPMLYSTGYLEAYNLIKYNGGFCLQAPVPYPPYNMPHVKFQDKLFEIFKENRDWCEIIGAKDIGTINKGIIEGHAKEIIQVSEALHERKFAIIADKIFQKKDKVKLVLIAGPSSSGKTTSSKRIALQLRVLGLNPIVISMDDFFVDREHTPKDENGNYDFESINALDLDLLNTELNQLFEGEEIVLPRFNFEAGSRTMDGKKIKMTGDDIVVMEGIHALNPTLTEKISPEKKFKVYASALTSLSIDENNSISTTDSRLLRRMVRDSNFRGISAEDTILRWKSVVAGENKNIFPYQENADIMFNSYLIYELPMLKFYAESLLRRIPPISPAYAESLRMIKFLSYVVELNPEEQKCIPPTSIMREFIGGSSFNY
ncbi:MAG: nucleoside kinase [Bacteroidales bacterium]|nr:nucleoside kinase [Bacteroidales bacterium]